MTNKGNNPMGRHEVFTSPTNGPIAEGSSIAPIAGRKGGEAMSAVRKPKVEDGETPPVDPIFSKIENHKMLVQKFSASDLDDDDPDYLIACEEEENALQELASTRPTSTAGAVALLRYMAQSEGDFFGDDSPFLRTVLLVADALSEPLRGRKAVLTTLSSAGSFSPASDFGE